MPPDSLLLDSVRWYTGEAGHVDDALAHQLLVEARERGDALSRMWVARVHSTGRMGFPRDRDLAQAVADSVIDEVEARALGGVLEAMFLMGTAYDEGLGRPEDPARAVGWYARAAELGHTLAQHNLGNAYRAGRGVSADAEAAIQWWRRAALQGDAIPQLRLAEAYRDGVGVPADTALARYWYEQAAARGNPTAQAVIGADR